MIQFISIPTNNPRTLLSADQFSKRKSTRTFTRTKESFGLMRRGLESFVTNAISSPPLVDPKLRVQLREELKAKGAKLSLLQETLVKEVFTPLVFVEHKKLNVVYSLDEEVVVTNDTADGIYFLTIDKEEDSIFVSFSGNTRGNYFAYQFGTSQTQIDEAVNVFLGN